MESVNAELMHLLTRNYTGTAELPTAAKPYKIVAVKVLSTAYVAYTMAPTLAAATAIYSEKLKAGGFSNAELQAAYDLAPDKLRVDLLEVIPAGVNAQTEIKNRKAYYAYKLRAEGYDVVQGATTYKPTTPVEPPTVNPAPFVPAPRPVVVWKAPAAYTAFLTGMGVDPADAARLSADQTKQAIGFRMDMATPAMREFLTTQGAANLPDDLDYDDARKMIRELLG